MRGGYLEPKEVEDEGQKNSNVMEIVCLWYPLLSTSTPAGVKFVKAKRRVIERDDIRRVDSLESCCLSLPFLPMFSFMWGIQLVWWYARGDQYCGDGDESSKRVRARQMRQ
jgi:hypothetical protein